MSFGVVKLTSSDGDRAHDVDLTLPRTDSKVGDGHCGVQVTTDPDLSFEEASARRDFTVNAIMWDPATGELMDRGSSRGRAVEDPAEGADDLRGRRLRQPPVRRGVAQQVLSPRQCFCSFSGTIKPPHDWVDALLAPTFGLKRPSTSLAGGQVESEPRPVARAGPTYGMTCLGGLLFVWRAPSQALDVPATVRVMLNSELVQDPAFILYSTP